MPVITEQFTNFASSTVAGGAGGAGTFLNAGDTSLLLSTGDGTKFPATANGTWKLLLGDPLGANEIVLVTARATDTLTIVRAQEGTSANTWAFGTPVQAAVTAGSWQTIYARIAAPVFYAPDYGAKFDGVTDDTAANQAAINAANAAGGGTVLFPPGTSINQTLTLFSNIALRGAGIVNTLLKLKNGTNADLINGGATNLGFINIGASGGTGNSGGLGGWGIYDLSLGGNKAAQSGTSWCVRIYGYDFILQNVRIANGLSGNLLVDWNGPGNPGPNSMEAELINCKIHDSGGPNVVWAGPQSSMITNCDFFLANGTGFYVGPHAPGVQLVNSHVWGLSAGNPQILVEGDKSIFVGDQIEGSDTMQIVLNANEVTIAGCQIYGLGASSAGGIQIGQQAGVTPYNQSVLQSAGLTTAFTPFAYSVAGSELSGIGGAHGNIWYNNPFNGGSIQASVWLPGAGVAYTGTPAQYDVLNLMVGGLAGQNSVVLVGGAFGGGVFGSTPATGTGGTIQTVGCFTSKVAPTGNITGVILQAGTFDGQHVTVINKSAFTIAFAVAGTSHVADGATLAIPANCARTFSYDLAGALWYRDA